MKAAFDREYVKRLDGTYVKKGKTKYDLALQIKDDIENFRKTKRVSRLVTCWCVRRKCSSSRKKCTRRRRSSSRP